MGFFTQVEPVIPHSFHRPCNRKTFTNLQRKTALLRPSVPCKTVPHGSTLFAKIPTKDSPRALTNARNLNKSNRPNDNTTRYLTVTGETDPRKKIIPPASTICAAI